MGNVDRVLVSVRAEPETCRVSPDAPLYLSGNIDVLVDDTLLVLGSFEGALLLVPSIDVLADGIRKVRSGHRTVEIVLVGDANSLWLVEKKGPHGHMAIAYRNVETALVSRAAIDQAFEQAIAEFLETFAASNPVQSRHHEVLRIFDNVISTWPNMAWLSRRYP